jgi:hypothetical protein
MYKCLLGLFMAVAASSWAHAGDREVLVSFEGGIGVEPLTIVGGNHVSNTVRGVAPGGRAWAIRKLRATIGTDGSIRAKGEALVFNSQDLTGSAGPVSAVGASLFCGPAATAARFDSAVVALDAFANFTIRGKLTQDGIHDAVMPDSCTTPVLLIRAGNAQTGVLGNWFAAGMPTSSSDD